MYSQQRPGDNRKELSAPGFEDCRVQVEERDSETTTRRGEATFPPLPCGENVHPSMLLPQPKCLCRPTGQGIRYLWLNQHRYQMGLTFSEEVRRSSSSKVSCIHPHPHPCLALCTCSQPLTSKLSCLNL